MKKIIFVIISVIILTGCDFLFPNEGEEIVDTVIVQVVNNPNVVVTPASVTVLKGSNVTFSYSIAVSDQELVSIIANGVSIAPSSNSFTLKNIDLNTKVYITTKVIEKPKFTIFATTGLGGKVTPSGDVIVIEGQNKTISITPNPGFLQDILKVNDIIIPSSDSYTFSNVTSNSKLDVMFKKDSILWPMLYIEWKEDSVYIDQYKWYMPDEYILNYNFSDNTFIRTVKGELGSPEGYILDRSKSPATITYGGQPCKIEMINEERYVISYINGFEQYVRLIFKNNKYKQL